MTHKGVLRALYALATGWTMRDEPPHKLRDGCAHAFALSADGAIAVERAQHPAGARAHEARVLFHVQHLLGVGHLRRAEILAAAMAADGLDVTVALGGRPVAGSAVPRRAGRRSSRRRPIAGEDFSTLLDADGRAGRRGLEGARGATRCSSSIAHVAPDVVLIELFPFGRRQFRFELLPLLEAAHATEPRPLVACSVRDILVASKKPGRAAEIGRRRPRRYFDAVLVHGDPALIPFGATFPRADRDRRPHPLHRLCRDAGRRERASGGDRRGARLGRRRRGRRAAALRRPGRARR